jgi:glucokinase
MTTLPVTVGIDLGGTGTRIVLLDATGAIHEQYSLPTPHDLEPGIAVANLIAPVAAAARGSNLIGVGIGASGPVTPGGIITNDETLPAFSHVPIATLIQEALDVPCVIDNDAVTAAIGENAYGAGESSPALLTVTLGTGIGVAFLCDDQPFRGGDGVHPEAGHIPVEGGPAPCYCGLPVCWEQRASRTALDVLTGGNTAEVASLAASGDRDASQLFGAYGREVGRGLSSLLTIFRPERVVLGGSAAQYLALFAPGLDAAIRRNGAFAWAPPYARAALGPLSGAVGAAAMARPGRVDGPISLPAPHVRADRSSERSNRT